MKETRRNNNLYQFIDQPLNLMMTSEFHEALTGRKQKSVPASKMRLTDWGRLRVAQLYCDKVGIRQHRADLLESGESATKVDGTEEWRECRLFSKKERLALALAEALTLCPESNTCRILFWYARHLLDELEFIELVTAIQSVNEWNLSRSADFER